MGNKKLEHLIALARRDAENGSVSTTCNWLSLAKDYAVREEVPFPQKECDAIARTAYINGMTYALLQAKQYAQKGMRCPMRSWLCVASTYSSRLSDLLRETELGFIQKST